MGVGSYIYMVRGIYFMASNFILLLLILYINFILQVSCMHMCVWELNQIRPFSGVNHIYVCVSVCIRDTSIATLFLLISL